MRNNTTKTMANVKETLNKYVGAIESTLATLLGINITLTITEGECYCGKIIYLLTDDVVKEFGNLGSFLFAKNHIESSITDGWFDNEGLYLSFDFRYEHNDGGTNGYKLCMLFLSWDGDCKVIEVNGKRLMTRKNGEWIKID